MAAAGRFAQYAGILGGSAGLTASLFVLFGPVVRDRSQSSTGGVETGTTSGIDWLMGQPDAGFALFAWPVLLGLLSIAGALMAWRGNAAWTAGVAATLGVFVIIGMMTIGLLFAPAAVLFAVAAGGSWAGD